MVFSTAAGPLSPSNLSRNQIRLNFITKPWDEALELVRFHGYAAVSSISPVLDPSSERSPHEGGSDRLQRRFFRNILDKGNNKIKGILKESMLSMRGLQVFFGPFG
jgi:hypothetical protein